MKKVLNIREPNVYARHLEAEVIHPLISVVHFDELEKTINGIEDPPVIITKREETKRKQRHVVSRGIKV